MPLAVPRAVVPTRKPVAQSFARLQGAFRPFLWTPGSNRLAMQPQSGEHLNRAFKGRVPHRLEADLGDIIALPLQHLSLVISSHG